MSIHFRNLAALCLASLCLAAVAGGCVRSLHPLYTLTDLVFEESLIGQWTSPDAEQTWQFTRQGNAAYQLQVTDQEDRSARFTARLTKIDDTLFMDFYPVRQTGVNPGFYDFHLLRVHTFARVDQTDPELSLSFLDANWVTNHLFMNPDALAHEHAERSQVLTASTSELREFIQKHLDNDEAFTDPILLGRDR